MDLTLDLANIGDEERAERTASGSLRVENQVHWARNYLVWAGLLDGSKRGIWALTPAGWEIDLESQTRDSAHQLFKKVRADHADEWGQGDDSTTAARSPEQDEKPDEEVQPLTDEESDELELLADMRRTLHALSPPGFENMCKRLLAELGLTQLRTVGQAGDRGIDVEGHLRVNPVVSFRVGVQCKLHAEGNKVVPSQIREVQGALGPFDRGIFITTSVFTPKAEEQANSPGYKPIDLIDGERLIELLRELQLGVKQVTEVDHEFFRPFGP